jgi:plastocyanin
MTFAFVRKFYSRLSILSVALSLAPVAMTSPAAAEDWADLKLTFIYDGGSLPAPKELDMKKDEICVKAYEGQKALSDEFLINPENKGIKNVALFPYPNKSGLAAGDIHPSLQKPRETKPELDNLKCIFSPRVMAVRNGETIRVKNSDQTSHNANFAFFENQAVNFLIPPGGFKDLPLTAPEAAPSPVECNVHPWMKAYVIVSDFPYTGLSDDKGVMTIEKLPANKAITFRVWHENQEKSISQVTFGGKEVEWKRGAVELTLKPGMNDLGEVRIKPEMFKP